jgi:hypothetical protein
MTYTIAERTVKLLMMDSGTVRNMKNFQNNLRKSVHLVASIIRKFVRMHGHMNVQFITSFVNRYASPGFNYQTQHVTGNNGITHIHNSGHNLPYTASRSKRAKFLSTRTELGRDLFPE